MKVQKTIKNILRFSEITQTIVKHGFYQVFKEFGMQTRNIPGFFVRKKARRILQRYRSPERARAFRNLLEELGPTFIKLGQYLSQREDLLPADYIKELKNLQENVKTISYQDIKSILSSELGGDISGIFKSIDENPLASASISQVHKAELLSGHKVVLKILKPEAKRLIEQDISLMLDIARNIDNNILKNSNISILEIITNLSRALERETDFLIEASHIEQFYKFYEQKDSFTNINIPQVFWDATTSNIITMERLDGNSIDSLILKGDRDFNEKCGERIIRFCYDQIFNLNIVHTDLHKGNIKTETGGRVVIYDFGQTYLVSKDIIVAFIDILLNIEHQKYERVVKTLLALSEHRDRIPAKQLNFMIEDTKDIIFKYYNVPLKRINVGNIIKLLFSKYRAYSVKIPNQIMMLSKALSYVEATIKELAPELNMFSYAREYINKYILHSMNRENLSNIAYNNAIDANRIFRLIPGSVENLLTFISELNRFTKKFSDEINDINITFRRTITSLCLSIIVASLVISSSFLIRGSITEVVAGVPVFGLLGYILAFIFSIIMIIVLIKSND